MKMDTSRGGNKAPAWWKSVSLFRFSLILHGIAYLTVYLYRTFSAGRDFVRLGYAAVFYNLSALFHTLVFNVKLILVYALAALLMGTLNFGLVRSLVFVRGKTAGKAILTVIMIGVQSFLFVHSLVLRPALFDDFISVKNEGLFRFTRWCTGFINPSYTGVALAVLATIAVVALFCCLFRKISAWFSSHRRLVVCLAVLLTGLLATKWIQEARQAVATRQRPDVFFIACDSLRADRVSGYGYQKPITPNIDTLIGQGMTCSWAFSNLARTAPAWASILTGAYPYRHGIYHSFSHPDSLRLELPTLPGELRKLGYWSFVAADYVGNNFSSCDMGFDRVTAPPDFSIQVVVRVMVLKKHGFILPFITNRAGAAFFPELVFMPSWSDASVLNKNFDNILKGVPGTRNVMGIVFYSNVHFPFTSPYPYYKLYADPDYYGPNQYAYEVKSLFDLWKLEQDPPAVEVEQIRNLYDGAVRYIDEAVGELVEILKKRGRYENSIIVFLSDHGEQLFENKTVIAHGKYLSGGDGALRIPLVFRFPGGKFAARTIEPLVRNIDIFPTIMECLEQEPPLSVEGESILPLLSRSGSEEDSRIMYAETGIWFSTLARYREEFYTYPIIYKMVDAMGDTATPLHLKKKYEFEVQRAKRRMVRSRRFKLIYLPKKSGAVYSLYDMQADPGQVTDISSRYPDVTDRFKEVILSHMRQIPGYRLDERDILQVEEK